jgi:hypothetical protein
MWHPQITTHVNATQHHITQAAGCTNPTAMPWSMQAIPTLWCGWHRTRPNTSSSAATASYTHMPSHTTTKARHTSKPGIKQRMAAPTLSCDVAPMTHRTVMLLLLRLMAAVGVVPLHGVLLGHVMLLQLLVVVELAGHVRLLLLLLLLLLLHAVW